MANKQTNQMTFFYLAVDKQRFAFTARVKVVELCAPFLLLQVIFFVPVLIDLIEIEVADALIRLDI
jgi:hypothetical protein